MEEEPPPKKAKVSAQDESESSSVEQSVIDLPPSDEEFLDPVPPPPTVDDKVLEQYGVESKELSISDINKLSEKQLAKGISRVKSQIALIRSLLENQASNSDDDVVPVAAPGSSSKVEGNQRAAEPEEDEDGGDGPKQPPTETDEPFEVPPHCIPIKQDVTQLNWAAIGAEVQFDVITMDPPWQLATNAPTRGVALGYSQLADRDLLNMGIPKIQKNGFLMIWVINAKYDIALEMFQHWGYQMVDEITWVKTTVNRRLAKGHGFYLQHAKETLLVGKKGADPPGMNANALSDVIFAPRRGQSQKPYELYELVEKFVPNGKYMEIFARRNNLRNYWFSVGLEL